MKDRIEDDNEKAGPQKPHKKSETNDKVNEDGGLLQNAVSDVDDVASGNQMDDDILTFDTDALENPNPTKQEGEENERPGGGLRK